MNDKSTPSLPVNYFDTVCEFVEQTYSDLLQARELGWLQSLNSLAPSAKILYVRLLNRSFNSFRVSKLLYDDVPDISLAVEALLDTPLATAAPPANPADVNRLFTKPEIIALFERHDLKNKNKAELVEAVYRDNASDAVQQLQAADQWISIQGHDVYSWFLLCFFGNRYQDISEFVMRDLGVTRYYPYALDKTNRAFTHREQIDAHLLYYESAAMYEHLDNNNPDALLQLAHSLPVAHANDPTLSRRVDRLRIKLARQLERIGSDQQALTLYKLCKRAPARERRVRVHFKHSEFDACWQVLNNMQAQPYCDEELQFVSMFEPKLAKASGEHQVHEAGARYRARRFKPISSKLVLKPIQAQRVEQIAQAYYQKHGKCFYVENALFNGVLGLLIWDEIFAPLAGAFFNPFQFAPADFHDPTFYQRRRASIEARLDEINTDQFAQQVVERFQLHQGIANPLVHWEALSLPLLELALQTIPKAHWHACFKRQLQDLRNNRTGFPDLIHFPAAGGYELIEIKGPGDAVQKNQNRWFAYFESAGVPYRVVHIKWAGAQVTS